MKIEQLKGKKLVGHYDIDEKYDLSPYYSIAKIEYFWGHFVIIGNGRGFRCSFTEEQFFELVAFGRVRIGTHNYWIEP